MVDFNWRFEQSAVSGTVVKKPMAEGFLALPNSCNALQDEWFPSEAYSLNNPTALVPLSTGNIIAFL